MQATDVAPSRIEVAKTKIKELVQGLSGSDRMLVARMDATTVPLSTMTSEPTELLAGLARVTAVDTRADLRAGATFALDALRGTKNAEIVLVSDGALDTSPLDALDLGNVAVRYLPVGKTGRNVAVTEFSVRRYPLDAAR
jgi:hypothetical protein